VTTTAPPTTATDAPGSTDEPAAVTGIVWFDRNADATLDAGEWTLPFVEVVLTRTTRNTTMSGLRTARTTGTTVSYAVTDAGGSYRFTGVQPGQYTVTATASIDGFDITSDTDGQTDWTVDVNAQAGQLAIADFAGLGRGTLTGSMFEVTTRSGISSAAVLCRWAGFDDVMNSADDMTFTATANADGTFEMRGVPYGEFSCTGTDPVTGTLSSVAAVGVWSPAPVQAPLPLNLGQPSAAPEPGITTPAPAAPLEPAAPVVPSEIPEPLTPLEATTPTGALPVTGSSSLSGLTLAAALLASGVSATLLARRRRQT
jgi:LPXTG-motif cell wall-anchored protein